MTRSVGSITLAAPCCGARYAYPRYTSMNFTVWAYWTDGWRDRSLMPGDEGLRRCTCGQFFLLKNTKAIEERCATEKNALPSMLAIPPEQLPECFVSPISAEVEVAARLGYWRYLNHGYRKAYEKHRDAEEASTRAEWIASNPDRRTWWDRLRGRTAPTYSRPEGSPSPIRLTSPARNSWRTWSACASCCSHQGLRHTEIRWSWPSYTAS